MVTLEEYYRMSPRNQGYVNYMQGTYNDWIPVDNPYPLGSKNFDKWNNGAFFAMLEAQDSE